MADSDSSLVVEPVEFYMVWTKTGHIPRRTHTTRESAEAEADRLARLKPHGKKYVVFRAYRKSHVPPATPILPSEHPAGARAHSKLESV